MTLTVAQSSRDYRARRKAKLERLAVLEEAFQSLYDETWLILGVNHPVIERARKALGDVG